jgi:hypothetical protein
MIFIITLNNLTIIWFRITCLSIIYSKWNLIFSIVNVAIIEPHIEVICGNIA